MARPQSSGQVDRASIRAVDQGGRQAIARYELTEDASRRQWVSSRCGQSDGQCDNVANRCLPGPVPSGERLPAADVPSIICGPLTVRLRVAAVRFRLHPVQGCILPVVAGCGSSPSGPLPGCEQVSPFTGAPVPVPSRVPPIDLRLRPVEAGRASDHALRSVSRARGHISPTGSAVPGLCLDIGQVRAPQQEVHVEVLLS